LKPLLVEGKPARDFEEPERIRSRVLDTLKELRAAQPSITWR
jgi:hypothetical protein